MEGRALIQAKPPQIAARASPSFSPMPPVKTTRSTPSSAAITRPPACAQN